MEALRRIACIACILLSSLEPLQGKASGRHS